MQKPTDIVTETSTEWDAIMSISLRRSHMLEYLKSNDGHYPTVFHK